MPLVHADWLQFSFCCFSDFVQLGERGKETHQRFAQSLYQWRIRKETESKKKRKIARILAESELKVPPGSGRKDRKSSGR